MLQEMLVLRTRNPPAQINGHRIYSVPPLGGNKQSGIVVHRDSAWTELGPPTIHRRSLGIILQHPEFGQVLFVCAHLYPGKEQQPFMQSIVELDMIMSLVAYDDKVVVGIDANANLSGVDESQSFVGPFTYTHPHLPHGDADDLHDRLHWKATALFSFLSRHGLRAENSFHPCSHGYAT